MKIQLRGGYATNDPRLDRLPQFDPRSRNYSIAPLVEGRPLRGRSWPLILRLDQRNEGACVGFSRAHDIAAIPSRHLDITYDTARDIYVRARRLDEWEGENYEGTSILAGVKAAREIGYVGEFRWAFGIDELVSALAHIGGVVIGSDWLEGMLIPRPSGLLDCSGSVVGGHAYFARGVLLKPRLKGEKNDEPVIRVTNSWGPNWGVQGECFIKVSDVERLLKGIEYPGEACIVTDHFKRG